VTNRQLRVKAVGWGSTFVDAVEFTDPVRNDTDSLEGAVPRISCSCAWAWGAAARLSRSDLTALGQQSKQVAEAAVKDSGDNALVAGVSTVCSPSVIRRGDVL
jgi:hypothetical protein